MLYNRKIEKGQPNNYGPRNVEYTTLENLKRVNLTSVEQDTHHVRELQKSQPEICGSRWIECVMLENLKMVNLTSTDQDALNTPH